MLAELAAAKMRGELVPVEEVARVWDRMVANCRARELCAAKEPITGADVTMPGGEARGVNALAAEGKPGPQPSRGIESCDHPIAPRGFTHSPSA